MTFTIHNTTVRIDGKNAETTLYYIDDTKKKGLFFTGL